MSDVVATLPKSTDLEAATNKINVVVGEVKNTLSIYATLKEVGSLLDQKVNVTDLNGTLAVVQNEVERCVREDDLKKSLNE